MTKDQLDLKTKKDQIYRPYLVQRLNLKPGKSSFGGMGPKGGLSDDLYKELMKICSIEGMGSREYENEAMPEALETLSFYANHNLLYIGQATLGPFEKKVYFLCHDFYFGVIVKHIRNWIDLDEEKWKGRPRDHHRTDFYKIMRNKKYDSAASGWICEDNEPFMFFTSLDQAKKFYKLIHEFQGKFHK